MAEPYAPLLSRRKILGGQEETTSGTANYPSAALSSTAVLEAAINFSDVYGQGIRRPLGNYLGTVKSVPGALRARAEFAHEVRPADQSLPLLTGAGFKLTTGTYGPVSTMADRKTWSFKLWEDGRVKQCYGAVASSLEIMLKTGAPLTFRWSWDGVWQDLATDASMPAQSALTTAPYICTGLTFTIGSAAIPKFETATIRIDNTVAVLPFITSATGLAYGVVTERTFVVSIDTEARKKADLNQYGLTTTATEVALSALFTSGVNTLTIAAPKMQRVDVQSGDRDGVQLDNVTFNCNASSGDDELTFTES